MTIYPINGLTKIYYTTLYNRLERVPSVEKIDGKIENYSMKIRDFDLFNYYTKKGIDKIYEKGIYFDNFF